jgi:hypothetical protein
MAALNRIKSSIVAAVGGTVSACGLAVAGLLALALVLIPGALAILLVESERVKRLLRDAKYFLLKTNLRAKKETA